MKTTSGRDTLCLDTRISQVTAWNFAGDPRHWMAFAGCGSWYQKVGLYDDVSHSGWSCFKRWGCNQAVVGVMSQRGRQVVATAQTLHGWRLRNSSIPAGRSIVPVADLDLFGLIYSQLQLDPEIFTVFFFVSKRIFHPQSLAGSMVISGRTCFYPHIGFVTRFGCIGI